MERSWEACPRSHAGARPIPITLPWSSCEPPWEGLEVKEERAALEGAGPRAARPPPGPATPRRAKRLCLSRSAACWCAEEEALAGGHLL